MERTEPAYGLAGERIGLGLGHAEHLAASKRRLPEIVSPRCFVSAGYLLPDFTSCNRQHGGTRRCGRETARVFSIAKEDEGVNNSRKLLGHATSASHHAKHGTPLPSSHQVHSGPSSSLIHRDKQAAGLGLDEKAVAAVSTYRFAPATRNGTPVPVAIHVQVKFAICKVNAR